MPTPFIAFNNETLDKLLPVKPGDMVHCPHCSQEHKLEGFDQGSDVAMFYKCEKTRKSYLGAINGKLIVGIKSDLSGEL